MGTDLWGSVWELLKPNRTERTSISLDDFLAIYMTSKREKSCVQKLFHLLCAIQIREKFLNHNNMSYERGGAVCRDLTRVVAAVLNMLNSVDRQCRLLLGKIARHQRIRSWKCWNPISRYMQVLLTSVLILLINQTWNLIFQVYVIIRTKYFFLCYPRYASLRRLSTKQALPSCPSSPVLAMKMAAPLAVTGKVFSGLSVGARHKLAQRGKPHWTLLGTLGYSRRPGTQGLFGNHFFPSFCRSECQDIFWIEISYVSSISPSDNLLDCPGLDQALWSVLKITRLAAYLADIN